MIVFQEIETTWTKRSRGGEGARKRNAVPDHFPLPATWGGKPDENIVLYQRIFYQEFDGFVTPKVIVETREIAPERWNHGNEGVALRLRPEGVAIQWEWSFAVGAPNRSGEPRRITLLQPNSWLKITYNGRNGYEDLWYYQKTVIRIAVTATYHLLVFDGTPVTQIASMADLW